jgi:hypothetical protein
MLLLLTSATNIDKRGKILSSSQKRGEDLQKFYNLENEQLEETEPEEKVESLEESNQSEGSEIENESLRSESEPDEEGSDNEEIAHEVEQTHSLRN